MEIGGVRPVSAGVTTPVPKAPAMSEQSVRTDVPVRAAISEAPKDEGSRLETGSASDRRESAGKRGKGSSRDHELDQKIEIDDATKTLVFKKIDLQSGDVVRQVPEEAMLRMRALIDAWGEGTPRGRTAAYDITT